MDNAQLNNLIRSEFSVARLESLARRINAHERLGGYTELNKAAALCAEELRTAGLADVRLLSHAADGVTTHMDFTMPRAWEPESAMLTIVEPAEAAQPLIDYPAMPLSIANRCAPTPAGGVQAEVITIDQLFQRPSAAGALVYTGGRFPEGWGRPEEAPERAGRSLQSEAQAKGALGYISDYNPARGLDSDASFWINGWGFPGWHQTAEDPEMVCFSITPNRGRLLAGLLERGPVRVHAEVRARIYDGEICTVSGLIPGRQEREIVLLAHIYEPFLCDDAVGAAALVEIGRAIRTLQQSGALPPLEFGIRLLIGMERYGFAAYFAQPGARENVLLAINMDAINLAPSFTGAPIEVRRSVPSMPFWGDSLLEIIAERELANLPRSVTAGNLSDDTFISDITIGIPTQWVWPRTGSTHHSSLWYDERINDWALGARIAELVSAYVVSMSTATRAEQDNLAQQCAHRMMGESEHLTAEWRSALAEGRLTPRQLRRQSHLWLAWQRGRFRSFAAMYPAAASGSLARALEQAALTFARLAGEMQEPARAVQDSGRWKRVPRRLGLGMPFCLARIPRAERVYANYEQALNWADGTRTLGEIAALTVPMANEAEEESWLHAFGAYCELLARYGYLEFGE